MRLLTLLLCSMCAGCAAARPAQVRFADELEGCLVAERPIVARTDQNLLAVSLPLHNVTDQDLELLVQVEFLDAGGNRYNDDTPRQVFRLARDETRTFCAVSMLSKADDFVAHVWLCR